MDKTAFLALGSNLGDRQLNLDSAVKALGEQMKIIAVSQWLSNPAIEGAGPDDFLNGVVKIETSLSPDELLKLTTSIEEEFDPERNKRGRKSARILDIDILSYGDLVIHTQELQIPHPRAFERDFVIKPILEIEPNYLRDMAKLFVQRVLRGNPRYQIGRMYLEDVDGVMIIEPDAFGEGHWTRNIFIQELNNPNAFYLVAKNSDASVLGYGGAWGILDEVHIMTLGVHPQYRRQNIAESIIVGLINTALEQGFKFMTLEVRESNIAAQKLYDKYNFYRLGSRKNYYEDNKESGLILWTENIQEEKFLRKFLINCKLLGDKARLV